MRQTDIRFLYDFDRRATRALLAARSTGRSAGDVDMIFFSEGLVGAPEDVG